MKAPVTIGSTPGPVVGDIVEIPAHIAVPTVYIEQYRREVKARVGWIVEAGVGLVAVAFFGYPHTWDYSMKEASQFTVSPS
ncbi:MAG: hypothetical protein V4630_18080 [Pseudomonadota bacterium]